MTDHKLRGVLCLKLWGQAAPATHTGSLIQFDPNCCCHVCFLKATGCGLQAGWLYCCCCVLWLLKGYAGYDGKIGQMDTKNTFFVLPIPWHLSLEWFDWLHLLKWECIKTWEAARTYSTTVHQSVLLRRSCFGEKIGGPNIAWHAELSTVILLHFQRPLGYYGVTKFIMMQIYMRHLAPLYITFFVDYYVYQILNCHLAQFHPLSVFLQVSRPSQHHTSGSMSPGKRDTVRVVAKPCLLLWVLMHFIDLRMFDACWWLSSSGSKKFRSLLRCGCDHQ